MTEAEVEALNAALLPLHEMVRSLTQDGETVWWHCKTVRIAIIDDPVAFAAVYGVVVAEE